MKTAYLSISFQNRQNVYPETEAIKQVLARFGINLFVFVDSYHFSAGQEKQMMQQAFTDIDSADLLVAEVSEKAIGVGIEIGYAIAKQKPVIYLRKAISGHSTTAAGSANHVIIYETPQDLAEKLTILLSAIEI
jgi:nucleoside 2-deoxyribosyltransferase